MDGDSSFTVSRVMEVEIVYLRLQKSCVAKIMARKDFSILDCFNEIDVYLSSKLTESSISKFLDLCGKPGISLSGQILSRLSPSTPLTLSTFHHLFSLFEPGPRLSVASIAPDLSGAGPALPALAAPPLVAFDLPELIAQKEMERVAAMTQIPGIQNRKVSEVKGNVLANAKRKVRDVRKGKCSVARRKAHTRDKKELKKEVLLTIRKIGELEIEVEHSRQDLLLCPDFTIKQLFAFFDVNQKGKISLFEVNNGFYDLGIYPNAEDLAITLKEFDRSLTGYLNLKDFRRMIMPSDESYKKIMISREKKCKTALLEDVACLLTTRISPRNH